MLPTAAHTTQKEERGRERKGSPRDIDYIRSEGKGWFCVIDPNNITKTEGLFIYYAQKNIKSAKGITSVQCALYSVHRNHME